MKNTNFAYSITYCNCAWNSFILRLKTSQFLTQGQFTVFVLLFLMIFWLCVATSKTTLRFISWCQTLMSNKRRNHAQFQPKSTTYPSTVWSEASLRKIFKKLEARKSSLKCLQCTKKCWKTRRKQFPLEQSFERLSSLRAHAALFQTRRV